MNDVWVRYEVETRWREDGQLLAWGFVSEFKRKEVALDYVNQLMTMRRKVKDYEARVVEVVRSGGRTLRRTVLPTGQLELPFAISTPGFVSGINYGKMF